MNHQANASLARQMDAASSDESEAFRFTPEQRKVILDTCCGGASPPDANALIAVAEQRGLNPILGECYFVRRWDGAKSAMVWSVQASIDAMRIKAEESGLYNGQDEPEFEYEPGNPVPVLARVKVWRKDWERPAVGVVRYSEYVQTTKDGAPTRFWRQMPHNQLAKCAEAQAMRKAFPKRFAKIYTADELAQAETDAPVASTQAPPRVTPDGEVIEATPPGHAGVAIVVSYESALRAADTLNALKTAWSKVGFEHKRGNLTLTEYGQLSDVKEQCKKAIVDRQKATAQKAVDEMGPSSPDWGMENDAAEQEPAS